MSAHAPRPVTEALCAVPALPIAVDQRGTASEALGPLIFNAWYVVALGQDVDRTLKSIQVLGESLVYYRSEAGHPIVLDDRCAHRRFRLSKGRLKGDKVQCGYHGFTYAPSGQCVWAPGLPDGDLHERKLPFGVRSYPCVERGPWLWVWMGQPELADATAIPLPALDIQPGAHIVGYKLNPANYLMLIENLLDLSHLHFLHGAADLETVVVLPADIGPPVDGVAWRKVVERTEISLAAVICGGDPKRLIRLEDEVHQFGPSLTLGIQRRHALEGDTEPVRPALMHIAHALTPADDRHTHQFFVLTMSDPFVIDPADVLHTIQDVVFEEDVSVLADVQAVVDADVRPGRVEFNMAYDVYGLKMRRILKAMKDRELSAAEQPSQ